MKFTVHPNFASQTNDILKIIEDFSVSGVFLNEPVRNSIKIFDLNSIKVNVKSFKKPNFLNKIIYGYFRKSKAKRSFEFANILLEKSIGTPQPIAYIEKKSIFGLNESFYMSEQLDADLLFRELTTNNSYPQVELILKQFTQFSYNLHEKGIEFIDNTSGNTLIKKTANDVYEFYLVDLNRMNFHHKMSFESRIKNLAKLTSNEFIIGEISKEYAKLSGYDFQIVNEALTKYSVKFQERFIKKRKLKRKLKFWQNSKEI